MSNNALNWILPRTHADPIALSNCMKTFKKFQWHEFRLNDSPILVLWSKVFPEILIFNTEPTTELYIREVGFCNGLILFHPTHNILTIGTTDGACFRYNFSNMETLMRPPPNYNLSVMKSIYYDLFGEENVRLLQTINYDWYALYAGGGYDTNKTGAVSYPTIHIFNRKMDMVLCLYHSCRTSCLQILFYWFYVDGKPHFIYMSDDRLYIVNPVHCKHYVGEIEFDFLLTVQFSHMNNDTNTLYIIGNYGESGCVVSIQMNDPTKPVYKMLIHG
jgi:hypothetical protein